MGVGGSRGRLGEAAAAFASNWQNPNLRRAQLSFLGAWTAEWAFTVALGIVAYTSGGALALGLVGLMRMVPSAVLAPLLSPFADRGRRERVLVVVSVVRGAATGIAALTVALSGPVFVVYALAIVSTIAATMFRPAHSALLPTLCRTGHELASANVVRGLLDSIATLVGPLLAAVLLAYTRCVGRVRCGCRGVVLGRNPPVASSVRCSSASRGAAATRPAERSGGRHSSGHAEPGPAAHPRPRRRAGADPWGADGVLGRGRDRAARHRRPGGRRADGRRRRRRGRRIARRVIPGGNGPAGRAVRGRRRTVGAAPRPDRRLSP